MIKKRYLPAVFAVFLCVTTVFSQTYKWNNTGSLPSGITHSTYHSTLINVDIGYNIYLPPAYASSTDRYPVIYSLHGMGGNEGSNCQTFSGILTTGINNKDFPPVIMVFVNGRGNTFYSDSKDGTVKCESSIIKELIPHIDATYRTKADRSQRAIEGISMGGFGALMLGFKHPDMFGSIASYDAALVNWDTLSQQQFDQSIPNQFFGNDRNYFNQNSYPFTFAVKNADTIKALGIKVRMITGDNDYQMGPLYNYNLAMRDTLKAHGISLDFKVISGGTHGAGMNQTTGKENCVFHTSNFSVAATHISNSLVRMTPVNRIGSGYYLISTTSSFRIPEAWHQKGDGITLYNLAGSVIGHLPTKGLTFIDGHMIQEKLGAGIYLAEARK